MSEASGVAAQLAALVRIPTVALADGTHDRTPFEQLLAELGRQFPLLHEHLEVQRVAGEALLCRWPGRSDERPVVLMAHLDVVPAPHEGWSRDPWGGEIADGAVWGRGTLDDKGSVVAVCAAVEGLLADGFTPAYDVWLSFGCDEEVVGGAATVAVQTLRERGVRPWFVLDEGGAIAYDALAGLTPPLGVVGVAEKGLTTLELVATDDAGHTSTPRRGGATARLAAAIVALDRASMPARTTAPLVELFGRIAPHLPRPARPLAARAGLLGPALTRLLPRLGPEAAALVRTTFAVTTLQGSPAHNVIAGTARAGVNVRLLPGDTVADVLAFVRRTVGHGVEVQVAEAGEASPVSPRDDAFALIERTIGEVFPEAVVTPYTVLAATDARFFTAICERVYRFTPFRMTRAQRSGIHGADEHLLIADLEDGVRWYRRLLEDLG